MKLRWLYRLTYLYLLLPFLLFLLGWLRLAIALPLTVVFLWILWQLWNQNHVDESKIGIPSSLLLISGLWIFLSGVGGYSFQNWDHHWRNAVLRDLITYDWPVYYSQPERGPVNMLIYYVGYWLPAALTGKLLGWKFANFILFLWTWLGVLLAVLHLSLRLKTSSVKTALFLILFSGLDALSALLFASEYPTLWPPTQHLEIWAGELQYSSFTTQLFWVFNQAVPAWLCAALILEPDNLLSHSPQEVSVYRGAQKTLLWSLCFFFAPLASLGLLPYLLIEWIYGILKLKKDIVTQSTGTDERRKTQMPLAGIGGLKDLIGSLRLDLLFASALILLLSYFYFSSNTAAQERGFQALAFKDILTFFLLEGGLLWLLLAPRLWRDPRWAVTGLLLLVIPFIQLGSGRDFVMRASIAPLFYLMVWSGVAIFQNGISRLHRMAIIIVLVIGALTPLYEINRSVYRTFEYYFMLSPEQRVQPTLEPVTHLPQGVAPEAEHPGALVADDIQTFQFMRDLLSKNFVANVRQSLYYRYLAPH